MLLSKDRKKYSVYCNAKKLCHTVTENSYGRKGMKEKNGCRKQEPHSLRYLTYFIDLKQSFSSVILSQTRH